MIGMSFAQILHFLPLPAAELAVHQGGSERATTEVFSLTPQCVNRMLQALQLADFPAVSAHIGHGQGQNVEPSYLPSSAWQIPFGVGHLISYRLWNTLCVSP